MQSIDINRVFSALADPTRRAIIERLCDSPASVSQLAKPLTMSLAAVVQHVQSLEASGLIESRKTGRVRTCRIRPATLSAVEDSAQRTPFALGTALRPARRPAGGGGPEKRLNGQVSAPPAGKRGQVTFFLSATSHAGTFPNKKM